MTVRYSREVANSTFFSSYRLFFKWKGSIWKSVLVEFCIWTVLYYLLKCIYAFALTEPQRQIFEDIAIFCNNYSSLLPITFMLAFYVSAIFGRWQKIWNNIGWIDTSALAIACHVRGTTDVARNLRRNIIRYLIFVQALVFRDISMPVKKRLPTMKHLVAAGFITEEELTHFDSLVTPNTKYYLPMQWALSLLGTARQMGLVSSDMSMLDVTRELYKWREQVVSLTFYDFVQVPLAYTQVINLAVSSFFIAALMGRQFLHPQRDIPGFVQPVDPFVPAMSMLQFIFLVGWTKVAECMLNPMGDDDDDFETNWLLDRNLQVGLALADSHYGAMPPLKKDPFWEESVAEPLYTPESAKIERHPQIGSCATISTGGPEECFMVRASRNTSLDEGMVPVPGVIPKPIPVIPIDEELGTVEVDVPDTPSSIAEGSPGQHVRWHEVDEIIVLEREK